MCTNLTADPHISTDGSTCIHYTLPPPCLYECSHIWDLDILESGATILTTYVVFATPAHPLHNEFFEPVTMFNVNKHSL